MAKKSKIDYDNLPSNNEVASNDPPAKKAKLRGPVKTSTKGGLSDEVRDVFNSQFRSMVIPSVLRLVYDFFDGAVRTFLLDRYGTSASSLRGPVSYNQRYRTQSGPTYHKAGAPVQAPQPVIQQTPYRPILFQNRADAEEVWRIMMDRIQQYGWCAVGHLYSICDMPSNFSHHRWGWTDVSMVPIVRTHEGYFLDLPEPVNR